ncbi:MAG: Hpt domain-containing protein [Campylobacterota bacterium]|nr:Hpt domain-containing protein [Campylobacterota bacterium]
MLIYDHNKQFLGIDDEDLKQLGFASAPTLFEQCSDFADLFVKRPGYIHNFKNFEWIDFVLHAEAEESNAIIHTAKNNFTCKLVIKPFYLNKAPDQSAYMVILQNLKPLSSEEDAKIAHDIEMHPMPTVVAPTPPTAPAVNVPLPDVSLPNFDNMPATELSEPDIFDVPDEGDIFPVPEVQKQEDAEPESTFPEFDPFTKHEEEPKVEAVQEEKEIDEESDPSTLATSVQRSNLPDIPMLGDKLSQQDHTYIDNLNTDKGYEYDPSVAANELGLPVDLIEEFIGDFIQQSHDFHDELFEKVEQEDRDSIQTLSHKLKGVAANLRIEDAFEVLTIINTSHDFDEIMANLKYYYHLVAKLEGDDASLLDLQSDEKEIESVEDQDDTALEQKSEIKPLSEVSPFKTIPDEALENIANTASEKEKDDEEIYAFDIPDKNDDDFNIPSKPPVFDDKDDDIYDFEAIEKEIAKEKADFNDDTRPQEEEEKEALIEIKQHDDEPLLIIEPQEEPKKEEKKPEREFLDVVETEEADDDFAFDEIAEKFKSLEEPSPKEAQEPIKDEVVAEIPEELIEEPVIDTPPKVAAPDNELHYNHVEMAHELGLPENLVKELIDEFKTNILLHVDELSDAVSSFDTTTWKSLAKEYKGICDNLRLNEISKELHILSQTNDAQKAKTALSRFRNYINQL